MTRNEAIDAAFLARYGRSPGIRCRAPGRVDLMGSHTDYNDGSVLATAIDCDFHIVADPRPDAIVRATSLNLDDSITFSLDALNRTTGRSDWSRYLISVAQVLAAQGMEMRGCDIAYHSTIPIGSGLSSSAALETGTALLFEHLAGESRDRVELAQLCRQAEENAVGVPCGVLDQYMSLLGEAGKLLLLDCRSMTHDPITLPASWSLVACDTCAPRRLSESAYRDRRETCEEGVRIIAGRYPDVTCLRDAAIEQLESCKNKMSDTVAMRCRFIIEEQSRVYDLAAAIDAGDAESVRRLMCDSFEGARGLYEICVPEMEALYDSMITAPGCIGARQSGAGFGGCMIALVSRESVTAFKESVMRDYQSRIAQVPEVFEVTPSRGAEIV